MKIELLSLPEPILILSLSIRVLLVTIYTDRLLLLVIIMKLYLKHVASKMTVWWKWKMKLLIANLASHLMGPCMMLGLKVYLELSLISCGSAVPSFFQTTFCSNDCLVLSLTLLLVAAPSLESLELAILVSPVGISWRLLEANTDDAFNGSVAKYDNDTWHEISIVLPNL